MGWFKKRKLESEPVRPTGRDERRDAGAYPKLYKNAPLDVTKLDGELITRARLIRFSAWELRLERLPGELSLPVLDPGDVVHVRGRSDNDSVEPFVLEAVVRESTRLFLIVDNLALVAGDGNRTSYRHGIWRDAELFDVENERLREVARPCRLMNVSMTGACVQTETAYAPGKKLRLRVELFEKAGYISFVSEIVRVKSLPDGRFEYGLLFEELTREKRRYLEDDLRTLQERANRAANL